MTHHESAHEETEDRFYAQFDSREVQLMTLDELQTAFEAGQIHENTFVCREGDSAWLTLAEVAGIGEEEEAEAPEPATLVETRPPMPPRLPEMPAALETRPAMPSRRPEVPANVDTRPPMPERRPEMPRAAETRPPLPERRPEMNTLPAARFQQAAAHSSLPIAVLGASAPLSVAPVTSNLDSAGLDLDELALRPKRRWGLALAAAALLALAGGGTVFALNSGARTPASAAPSQAAHDSANKSSSDSLTMTDSEPKSAEALAAPEPVAPSTPDPRAPSPEASAAASSTPQFSDDMKQALLAADKSRVTKRATKVKNHATVAAPHRAKAASSSAGFKSGGSAYDPLNGKL